MSRQKIVAGNWKMNLEYKDAVSLVEQVVSSAGKDDIKKIFIPAYPFISSVSERMKEGFYTGAQNCSEYAKGAYTGEVSAAMLKSAGASYVVIGHSERRQYYSETSQQLMSKIQQALAAELNVIYCFGEQLEQRKSGAHFTMVKTQLDEVLQQFPAERTGNLVLAYEPVWAIGTGETASPEQAQEMHAFVRKCLKELFGEEAAFEIPVIYGGSCNAQNAKTLFGCEDVDGGLIGGASLKAEDFISIIRSF